MDLFYRWNLSNAVNDSIGSADSDVSDEPTWVTNFVPESPYSQCGNFDGSSDYIGLTNANDINGVDTYTKSISLWFKADIIDTDGHGSIIWEEGGGTNWLGIYVYEDSGTDKLYGVVGESAGSFIDYVSTPVSTNTLYHVGFTMSCGDGELHLYLNGNEVDNRTGGLNIGGKLAAHTGSPGIGGPDGDIRNHNGDVLSGYFDGKISDIVYYAEQPVLNGDNFRSIYIKGTQ